MCGPQGSSHLVIYHMWLNHWTSATPPPTSASVEQHSRQESGWTPEAGPLIGTRQLAADQSQAAPST